jgi:hypothetical protein
MVSSGRHLPMLRSYTAADLLTIGNAACGTIRCTLIVSTRTSGLAPCASERGPCTARAHVRGAARCQRHAKHPKALI